jgi:hypothetical protein
LKAKLVITLLLLSFISGQGQINTFSPYSRFGLGELNQLSFAHNQGMGGAHIALKPDSVFPVMINTGNPASYALIKFATFEVGGSFQYSELSSGKNPPVKRFNTNFNYGALGFPIRKRSGAAFGIMPYSHVGYNMRNTVNETNIGNVNYNYNGEGGFSKVFFGYGLMPFKERMLKFRKKMTEPRKDSTYKPSLVGMKLKELCNELLSDFSIGANANYVFGSIRNYADVQYPNPLLYFNSIREKTIRMNAFTGNFGVQTAFTIDSVKRKSPKDTSTISQTKRVNRILSEKIKFTFGYFMSLNNQMNASYDLISYNYFLSSGLGILPKDTVIKIIDAKGKIKLPLEQGFGIGFKKGERINIVADYAITNWSDFKLFDYINSLKNNSRIGIGFNYVPDKFATGKGTYFLRTQYRAGAFHQTGYLDLRNTMISTYGLTAGISLPVGSRTGTGLINIGFQVGQTGSQANNLVKENFYRVHFGFTFNSTYFDDLWFRKFRYD